ncbi:hypothetical protein P0F65_21355 [Sphingomonas sp. I4]
MLVDDGAIRDEGVATALAAIVRAAGPTIPVHVLWPQAESLEGNDFFDSALVSFIGKPVAGSEVMSKLFGYSSQTANTALVTQAA